MQQVDCALASGHSGDCLPRTPALINCDMNFLRLAAGLLSCVLLAVSSAAGADAKSGKQRITEGTFAGIEQGDYAHLLVKTASGKQESYFVLQVDKSVQPYVEYATKMRGRKVRVYWREKMENLPEAGGRTRVQVVERIEALK
jgi:hypothetical protein